jgi:hypothetical protein
MNLKTKEVISLRVNPEDKQIFEELTRSLPNENKSQLFYEMLKAYQEKTELNQTTKTPEPIQAETAIETEETEEKQIVISLNPVQYFAIKETILKPGFIEETNKTVNSIDNAIDNTFFGNELYSGLFAGVFKKMVTDQNEKDSMNKNIDAVLINLFMANILTNSEYLESPVSKAVLKRFIKDQAKPETGIQLTEESLGY